MESPSNHGGSEEEEYSSCESGWTMYIEDAFHGNDHSSIVVDDEDDGSGDIDDDLQVQEAHDNRGDEESDDSMASDASSGPSNQLPRNIINKHAAGKKDVHLQKHQHIEKPISKEGAKSDLKAKTRTGAASRIQNKGKVSKTE